MTAPMIPPDFPAPESVMHYRIYFKAPMAPPNSCISKQRQFLRKWCTRGGGVREGVPGGVIKDGLRPGTFGP